MSFRGHTSCPKCSSSDAFADYGESGGGHCFSCGYTIPSEEYREEKNDSRVKIKRKETMEKVVKEKEVISDGEKSKIKGETGTKGKGFRGLDDDITTPFGVRYSYSEETGDVLEQYYPCTQGGKLVGYKVREVPKDFYSIGRTGSTTDCFMQFKFTRGGKYVVITEGEIDALSAYQMLKRYNESRNSEFETAVVSPTIGAKAAKQIAANYQFFDSFDNIIVCYDNDKAGQDSIEDIIKVLPKGKVKVMQMRFKDANEYLQKGESKAFLQDFYNAKAHVPVGVLASTELYDRILQQSAIPKVPFPPFMQKLNEMFVGGMPLGHIINVAADTGVGKTTLVNEMIYYWIFNSPHRIGIVSMELDAGQYGEALLSRHLSKKLSLIPELQDKLDFLGSDEVRAKSDVMMYTEDGQPRFFLLDNRDGSVEEIQDTIEELVISCGCKVIVLDPLQDILDGLSTDEQATFMKWSKGFIKSHGVLFVYINHMRKAQDSGEQDIMGSSTIIKSASANIILKRDKLAEDPIERNTTEISVPKNRVCGITGPAGAAYYDNLTHTLHDKEKWLSQNGTKDF